MTRYRDCRSVRVPHPPAVAFAPLRRIGGSTGWYAWDRLWRLRGLLDRAIGGPGLAGRTDPDSLGVGDTVDFWRVGAYEPDRLLRLDATMRVPGTARLEFRVEPDDAGGSTLTQDATFDAPGPLGRLYWYAVLPFHGLVFGGMLRGLVAAMEDRHRIGTESSHLPR